jgi:hypothetical protein
MRHEQDQALLKQLQSALYELYCIYDEIPMHSHERTEKLLEHGLLLLAEWSGSQSVPSLQSVRVVLVARAVQAVWVQFKQEHPLVR